MKALQLEDFFCTLPKPDTFIGKNIYIWGIGSLAQLYQEGLAREKNLNVCGYTVSEGYEVSNYAHMGGGIFTERNYSLLQK